MDGNNLQDEVHGEADRLVRFLVVVLGPGLVAGAAFGVLPIPEEQAVPHAPHRGARQHALVVL